LRTNASSSGKQSHIESPRIENTDKAVGAMFSIIWESLREMHFEKHRTLRTSCWIQQELPGEDAIVLEVFG
jgi:hypothetical protein